MKIELVIPLEVSRITQTLEKGGFQAYLVGGCVRDLLLNVKPKDWDITTDATPNEIMSMFPKTVYMNDFGTVTVVNETAEDESLKNVEVTPYRLEAKYSDKRHPDQVKFSKNIEDDLSRRDFTINAIAYNPSQGLIIDLYGGIGDLKDKVIKTVGKASERFDEDPLRILRAVRFSAQLGFTINIDVQESIKNQESLLKFISIERIREEFNKMLMSSNPATGINLSYKLGIWKHIVPEMEKGIGMEQNKHHIYTVWDHTLKAVQHSADKNFPLHIRLAALFHDIGKITSRRWSKENNDWTFYGHDVVGERVVETILKRLKYSNNTIDIVKKLVRNHMFFSDIEKITLSAVRRIISNVGTELIWDLMKVRECDRIGMGRPVETPYRLKKYKVMIEEALRTPTSVTMLKIDGKKIMDVTRETPGPKIGHILNALLEEVLEDVGKNTEEYLENRAVELNKLEIKDLIKLSEEGKRAKEKKEEEELKKIRSKYGVK